jgi:hypothetical protein
VAPTDRDLREAGVAIVRTVDEPITLVRSVAEAIAAERDRVVDVVDGRFGVDCVCRACMLRALA